MKTKTKVNSKVLVTNYYSLTTLPTPITMSIFTYILHTSCNKKHSPKSVFALQAKQHLFPFHTHKPFQITHKTQKQSHHIKFPPP